MVALTLITIMLVTISANFFAEAASQDSTQTLLTLTQQTKNQLDALINQIKENETTLQTAENYGLRNSFDGNVSLYAQGVENLTLAESQFASGNYDSAQASLIQALNTFHMVYTSMNSILNICDPQPELVDAQGLLEANNRAREQINWLRTVVPENATNTLALLNQAENCFNINSLNQLTTQEKITQTIANMEQGNALLAQVYQFLKTQGEESDSWRLTNYCNNMIAMIQERFQYGNTQGVDVNGFMQSMGYNNEAEYIAELQQRIQEITSQPGDIQNKFASLNELSGLIQNTDQALNQEIIQQGGTPNPDSGTGASSDNSGPSASSPATTGGTDNTGGNDSGSGQSNSGGNGSKR
jgi:hypothetical protein